MPFYLWIAYVVRLAAGIQSIQASHSPVNPRRAVEYAAAAAYHGFRLHIDPYELVAVARNESDFVPGLQGPDGKDCGLTQTRITVSRYSCQELRRDYWIDFAEAARELSEYREACRGSSDYDRCRINKYNSGARYSRAGFHGRYYLRILCFADAAREGVPVAQACRQALSLEHIRLLLERHRPLPKTMGGAGLTAVDEDEEERRFGVKSSATLAVRRF